MCNKTTVKQPGSNLDMESIVKIPINSLITNSTSNLKLGNKEESHVSIFQNLSDEANSSRDCENSLLSEDKEDNFLEFNDTFHTDLGNVTETSTVSHDSRDNVEMNQNSPIRILGEIRKNNLNKIVIGHLNINHFAGKFENLKHII